MFVSASDAIIHRLRQEGSLGIDSPDKYPIEMLIRARYITRQLDWPSVMEEKPTLGFQSNCWLRSLLRYRVVTLQPDKSLYCDMSTWWGTPYIIVVPYCVKWALLFRARIVCWIVLCGCGCAGCGPTEASWSITWFGFSFGWPILVVCLCFFWWHCLPCRMSQLIHVILLNLS